MIINIHNLKYFLLPCILFAATISVAMFALQSRDWLLPVLFLLLPFIDTQWRIPRISLGKQQQVSWIIITMVIIILLQQNAQLIDLFTVMLLVAALPEEWFFRAYLQKQLGNNITAIISVSIIFTLMHFITSNSFYSLLVFIPSVIFGITYKKTDDIILLVMLHALSNLLFYINLES